MAAMAETQPIRNPSEDVEEGVPRPSHGKAADGSRTGSKKPLATPRQLVVVAVLGVILAAVVLSQWGGGSAGSSASTTTDHRAASQRPATIAAAKDAPSATAASRGTIGAGNAAGATNRTAATKPPWPQYTAAQVAQHDPFAAASAETAKNGRSNGATPADASRLKGRQKQAIINLKNRGINAVVRDAQGAAAVVGNRLVRVGDVVEGYRVVAIDRDGLVLSPPDAQNNTREEQP
jgi:type II secretory pathway pseudopilin PulG